MSRRSKYTTDSTASVGSLHGLGASDVLCIEDTLNSGDTLGRSNQHSSLCSVTWRFRVYMWLEQVLSAEMNYYIF